jgi:hypothetical protein
LLQLLEQKSLDVDPVLTHFSNSSHLTGLPLEEVSRSERLLAVTWP